MKWDVVLDQVTSSSGGLLHGLYHESYEGPHIVKALVVFTWSGGMRALLHVPSHGSFEGRRTVKVYEFFT